MCRLFGFRSILKSYVHSSLVNANNALLSQSNLHPDGWGVAYYVRDAPHLIKSTSSAFEDHLFQRVSGIVASETVLAHLRKSTIGKNSITNTHPFQFGEWVFAHNGNIENFSNSKDKISKVISSSINRYRLGETDSEMFFYFLLTKLEQKNVLTNIENRAQEITEILAESIDEFQSIVGAYSRVDSTPDLTYLSFILTNGKFMIGFNGGKTLHYSTHKVSCPDKFNCHAFSNSCENKVENGKINHLVISSEPTNKNNIWKLLNPGTFVFVDENMNYSTYSN